MTPMPVTETPLSTPLESKARLVWIEPEIEALTLEQTEFGHGVGPDGRTDASDSTKS